MITSPEAISEETDFVRSKSTSKFGKRFGKTCPFIMKVFVLVEVFIFHKIN